MPTMTTIQMSDSRIGCSEGKLPARTNGLGLPNSWRQAEVMTLIGFHSVNGWSHVGIVAMGTNALDTNDSGKMTMNETCWATSTVGTDSPSQTPIHDIAKANRRSSPKPARNDGMPLLTLHPTRRPDTISTIRIPPW